MPTILDIAAQFRSDLAAIERDAVTQLVGAYAGILSGLQAELRGLVMELRQQGTPITMSQLRRNERLRALIRQVETEITRLALQLETMIPIWQSQAATLGERAAEQLFFAGLGPTPEPVRVPFNHLPTGAIAQMVGTLANGSPLKALLAELGPEAAANVRSNLLSGLAQGLNPRSVARKMKDALGGSLTRALTIARTEMLRAYREANRAVYEANSDVLEGWVWVAKIDRRTCAFCWAQHGSFHRLGEPMATHPQCRCAPIPRTKSWADLGFPGIPDQRPLIPAGSEVFARLPVDTQRFILGPAKFRAFQDGELDLEDVVGFRIDPKWGPVGWERSLRDILGSRADEWLEAAD